MNLPQRHIRLSNQPEAFVAGSLLLQVVGEQVRVHLQFQELHACFLWIEFVDVFGGFGIKVEGGKQQDFGTRRPVDWSSHADACRNPKHLAAEGTPPAPQTMTTAGESGEWTVVSG